MTKRMRKADHTYKNKRTKGVLLNEMGFLIHKAQKKHAKSRGVFWSFSDYVNKCLVRDFGHLRSEEDILRNNLLDLQAERDEMERQYEARIIAAGKQLSDYLKKEEKKDLAVSDPVALESIE